MNVSQNKNGAQIIEGSGSLGDSVFIDVIICEEGETYYVSVDHVAFIHGYSNELYTLSMGMNLDDVYECNDDLASAAQIIENSTIKASIGDYNDKDFFKYTTLGGEILRIVWEDIPVELIPRMRVYDEPGNSIGYAESNQEGTVKLEVDACALGLTDYYIGLTIQPLFSGYSQDLYSLTVNTFEKPPVYVPNSCPEFDDQFTSTEDGYSSTGRKRTGRLSFFQVRENTM